MTDKSTGREKAENYIGFYRYLIEIHISFRFLICYNRSGNTEVRSIYEYFRALLHIASLCIIEAEIRKREAFTSISAPCCIRPIIKAGSQRVYVFFVSYTTIKANFSEVIINLWKQFWLPAEAGLSAPIPYWNFSTRVTASS